MVGIVVMVTPLGRGTAVTTAKLNGLHPYNLIPFVEGVVHCYGISCALLIKGSRYRSEVSRVEH